METETLIFPSLDAAARFAGVSRDHFAEKILPELPHRRVGRRVLVSRNVLTHWLEATPADPVGAERVKE